MSEVSKGRSPTNKTILSLSDVQKIKQDTRTHRIISAAFRISPIRVSNIKKGIEK